MERIKVERAVPEKRIAELGVRGWPVWSKEESVFPWTYDTSETCYFLEGDVTVTPEGGQDPVRVGEGDLVTFPAGMSCTWNIIKAVRKHYRFG
jgi:hypothetical protein